MNKEVLNWILGKVNRFSGNIILLVVLNVICATSSVVVTLYTKGIIDSAVAKNINGIIHNVVVLVIILLVFLITKVFAGLIKEKTKSMLEISMRTEMLNVIVGKEYSAVNKYHSGDLLTRMFSDIVIICEGIVSILPGIASVVTGAVSAFILLSTIDLKFTVVLIVGGVVTYFAARVFRDLIKNIHKSLQGAYGKLRSYMQEVIINLLAVKTNDIDGNVEKRASILQKEHYKLKMKKRKVSIAANTGLEFVFDFGYLCALLWSAVGLSFGSVTYGTVTAVLQLVTKIQQPFAAVSGILPNIYSVSASVERILEINDIPDEIDGTEKIETKDLKEFSLKFSNVDFSYDRDKVFDGLDLTVNQGEFVAIVGSSGIGKSTALKLLLGVLGGYSGSITLETSTSSFSVCRETRKLFSYVPQGNLLFSGSLRENLCFMTPAADEDVINKALKLSCCDEFVSELPDGIDTVIGENGHGLSEGQVQRLAIARALLKNAPVLLLDEATSALDELTESKVLNNLKSIDNLTCVIVSHKKAALEVCDNVYKIEYGKAIKI